MGYIGRIPIHNVWLLMFYASDLYRYSGDGTLAVEKNPDDLANLVAEILAHRVEHRLRRQLSTGFRSREAVLNRVRGRIDLHRTMRHRLLDQGLVACRFDELSLDTLQNQVVLAALETMAVLVNNRHLAAKCGTLALRLRRAGVSGTKPTRCQVAASFDVRLPREDEAMMAAARLAFDLALPTEQAGRQLLPLPDREERWARRLFEKAVAGFYSVVARPYGWNVSANKPLKWNEQIPSPGIKGVLPTMKTDIVLDHPLHQRRIVIDTKFNEILTSGWYRPETLRSGYLYQMYAYLRSQDGLGDSMADNASGLLLHPAVGYDLDESCKIQGHSFRFATVDLAASAKDIRNRLMHVIDIPNTIDA
ncbi:MAG: 5-methylcytosine-specific restriction endonuclease system specificity protein McrC [Caldilineaceae bacterium SB0665_bin_21]|nr:5-methylcytosine-specific restriction endonuclease system specificity protein McrC [Caldilineaceae bacterium SB0665_bin_21]